MDEACSAVVRERLRRWRGVVRIYRRRTLFLDDRPPAAITTPTGAAITAALRSIRAAMPTPVARAPALPEEEREQQAAEPDGEEHPADGVDVDGRVAGLVYGDREHEPDRNQQQTDGHSHAVVMADAREAETFPGRARPDAGSCPVVADIPPARESPVRRPRSPSRAVQAAPAPQRRSSSRASASTRRRSRRPDARRTRAGRRRRPVRARLPW